MRVSFVLPSVASIPFGGFKVIYEHANRLAARGHAIRLVHPRMIKRQTSALQVIKQPLWLARERRRKPWFEFDSRVERLFVTHIDTTHVPDADAVVATSWKTAGAVSRLSAGKGRQLYFVQDYEYWRNASPAERKQIGETFALNLEMISISSAVSGMIAEYGSAPLAVINSGIDHHVFRMTTPPADRSPATVGFPFRTEEFKGAGDAVAALAQVRERFPDLEAWAFGAAPGRALPTWIRYLHAGSDEDIAALLNRLAIFIVPSWFEGWGLPGIEASACGAALVTTDNGGARDYAEDGRTALVVPPGDPRLLADRILRLIEQTEERKQIAWRGMQRALSYRWDDASDSLEAVLLSVID